jgi:hypothetical protein
MISPARAEPPTLDPLPDINPAARAIASYVWGDRAAFYLVSHDGKYLVWVVRTADEYSWAWVLPSEAAARSYMARQFAWTLFGDTEEAAAKASAADPDGGGVYEAIVADGGEAGIWLATQEGEGEETDENSIYALAGFADLGTAIEAFARSAENAAERLAGRPQTRYPDLVRAHLRNQAAQARAGAARAVLGDAVRSAAERLRAERAVRSAAYALGVSREFLYRVMGGGEWTWQGRGAGVPPPTPPREPAPAGPALDWLIRVNLGISADGEAQALEVARVVLTEMALPVRGDLAAIPHGVATWAVQAELDLDGVEFEPDNAASRLYRVTQDLPEVHWSGILPEDGQSGVRYWPPSFFADIPGQPFPFPEVVAVQITAMSRPKDAVPES